MTLHFRTKSFIGLFALLLLATSFSASAQKDFFIKSNGVKGKYKLEKNLRSYTVYNVNETAIKQYLSAAPLDGKGKAPLALKVPMPNGVVKVFEVVESQILSAEIAAQHPEIKTYTGAEKGNQGTKITISFTANGFDAVVLGVNSDAVYFQKANPLSKDDAIISYFGSKATHPGKPTVTSKCGTEEKKKTKINTSATTLGTGQTTFGTQNLTSTGGTLHTYKLAVAATAEFTTQKGAGNVNNAFAALVGYVNRMIAVYKSELSVSFTLVSGTNLVYTTVGVPYTNSNQTLMLTQNQANVDNVIGTANYDLSFVLGTAAGSGGGVAASPSVGDANSKAQDASGVGDGSYAAIFDDQLVAHEVGHQFGMSHSFNSSIPVCTTREPSTSAEVGSGTTIMSYGYTCSDATGNDDYENPGYMPILNFHAANYSQATTFLATIPSVGTTSVTTNVPPVITSITADKTIPKSTPFYLTGTATDANAANVLSYSWEGTNVGVITPVPSTFASTTQPPFFRSYAPVATAIRYFPRLSAILDGSNYAKGDKLPSVGVVTTHRFTVRDNVDGINTGTVTVTVDGNSGPFLETTNLSGSYASSSTQTITWSVNNTTAAPVNCASVDILLSVDGGQTFPYTLLTATPNDGTQAVTLPNLPAATTTARIKVQANNNIFFDISNNNFSIAVGTLPVTITGIKAYQKNAGVQVEWTVLNETNINSYDIEKSSNGISFTKVGKVTAINTNTYNWLDAAPTDGNNYYRIKVIDNSGDIKFSETVNVKIGKDKNIFSVVNNPVLNKKVLLQMENTDKGIYTINLYNQLGQLMNKNDINHNGGSATYSININNLSKGVYQLAITNTNGLQITKTILIN